MTTQEKPGEGPSEKQGTEVRPPRGLLIFLGTLKEPDRQSRLAVLHAVLAISSGLTRTTKNSTGAE